MSIRFVPDWITSSPLHFPPMWLRHFWSVDKHLRSELVKLGWLPLTFFDFTFPFYPKISQK